MRNVLSDLQWVLCDIDFYNEDTHQGDSFLPFIGFLLFLAGLIFVVIGIIRLSVAIHRWNLYYDMRDQKQGELVKYDKERKNGIVMIIIGAVALIASFIIL